LGLEKARGDEEEGEEEKPATHYPLLLGFGTFGAGRRIGKVGLVRQPVGTVDPSLTGYRAGDRFRPKIVEC
jgi:hypothetical protein